MTFCKFQRLAALGLLLFISVLGGTALAATAEDLALPVRKGAPAKPKTSTAKEAEATKSKPAASKVEGKSTPAPAKASEKKPTDEKKSAATSSSTKASASGTAKASGKEASSSKSPPSARLKPSPNPTAEKPKTSSRSTATSKRTGDDLEKKTADKKPAVKPKPVRKADEEREDEDAKPETPKRETAKPSGGEVDLPEPEVINATTPPPVQAATAGPTPVTKPGGFLRRLFGGGRQQQQQQQSQAAAPNQWNTDYATRAAAVVVPAMLTGIGWGGVDLPIGSEDQYRLNTLPSDFRPTDLILIPKEWCFYGNPMYLRREAAESLLRMFSDAAREGKTLLLVSGYRDYGHQLRLYNEQVAKRGKNQKTVARPGRSEHQLGTTADVTNSKTHLLKRSFMDTPEGQWLVANAGRYGWKMTVLRGDGPRSHADEPWHIRYLGTGTGGGQNVAQNARQQAPRRSLLGRLGQMFKRSN